MGVVVTYDVGSRQEEVISAMLRRGYSKGWTIGGVAYVLPQGSLWHETARVDAALADIESVANDCGVELDGAMAVETAPWALRDASDGARSGIEPVNPTSVCVSASRCAN